MAATREPVWQEINDAERSELWDRFEAAFAFKPSSKAPGPAISEPPGAVTFDLTPVADTWAVHALNALVIRSFVQVLAEGDCRSSSTGSIRRIGFGHRGPRSTTRADLSPARCSRIPMGTTTGSSPKTSARALLDTPGNQVSVSSAVASCRFSGLCCHNSRPCSGSSEGLDGFRFAAPSGWLHGPAQRAARS